jgi:hypothetical protein
MTFYIFKIFIHHPYGRKMFVAQVLEQTKIKQEKPNDTVGRAIKRSSDQPRREYGI